MTRSDLERLRTHAGRLHDEAQRLDDAADEIERLQVDATRHSAWILVAHKAPEDGRRVLAWGPKVGVIFAVVRYGFLRPDVEGDAGLENAPVTHWLPLPPPPEP